MECLSSQRGCANPRIVLVVLATTMASAGGKIYSFFGDSILRYSILCCFELRVCVDLCDHRCCVAHVHRLQARKLCDERTSCKHNNYKPTATAHDVCVGGTLHWKDSYISNSWVA